MKKIILIILSIVVIPNVYASSIVMDMDTNRVLYEDNAYTKKLIASTTKIMTAIVVINHANLDEIITVDESVLKSFGSGIYIEIGEKISIKDLLYGLLLRSGNDAAIVLANHVGGSIEGFALLMNDLAKNIGMNDTYFINASGLENEDGIGNTSTSYDMALLMSYAMKNEVFKTITITKKHEVKTNYKTYIWYNKNKLLSSYKYTTGGKTGYTKKAYRTLVTSASKDNKNLIVVTLDEADDFNKHKNLYEKYFKEYNKETIIDSTTFLVTEGLKVKENYSMLLTKKEKNNLKIDIQKTDDIIDRYGIVTVSLNDNIYFKTDIYKYNTENLTYIEKMKLFFKELFS